MSQLVTLILKILSDLEPLRGSSNKKTLYSTRSCVNYYFRILYSNKLYYCTQNCTVIYYSNRSLYSIANMYDFD
jgi:hypothetical protein